MARPWKDVQEMDHDELRRYAHDLVREWVDSAPEENVSDLVKLMDTVGRRMEALGIKPVVTLREKQP